MKADIEAGESTARIRAIVIHPVFDADAAREPQARLDEACGLAEALDLDVRRAEVAPLRKLTPATYFGSGRVEALAEAVKEEGAFVVVVDATLTPVQQRNLERAIDAKVVDRTGLILEIFARRAHTREGRLQVELARLGYEKSRLVRTWTHLERQRGGLGKTGGPGETQLEIDRRLIAKRIDKLKLELEDVRRTRGLQRRARKRAGLAAVVLVGYTNAGKSSLFNRLTAAGVLAKDMPFATLDPTARAVKLPSGRSVIMADTVGFISDLPTELIAAFRATLEAVTEADVLIHVRDVAHPDSEAQRRDVLDVLALLPRDNDVHQPIIEAWNKIDLLPPEKHAARAARAADEEHAPAEVAAISALTGEGVNRLMEIVDRVAYGPSRVIELTLEASDGRTRAWLGANGRVLEETTDDDGTLHVRAELPATLAARFDPPPEPKAPARHAAE